MTGRTGPVRRAHAVPAAPTLDAAMIEAARAFFPHATAVGPAAGRSHLARVETPEGTWCVRRWPEATPRDRIDFVHTLLREARDRGIAFVPAVANLPAPHAGAVLILEGTLYDAQSWLAGRPPLRGPEVVVEGRHVNRPAPLPAGALPGIVEAVARWHAATSPLVRQRRAPLMPLDVTLGAIRRAWTGQWQRLRPAAPQTPHIQRWIRTSEQVLDAATRSLAAAGFLRSQRPVIAHLNLWPAHILLSPGRERAQLTGLLDFTAAAASSPLLDIAQLITHFDGWTVPAAEEALTAYAGVIPLAPEERRLLPAIAALDLLAETGRLLTLAYRTDRRVAAPEADALRAAAAALLASLETLAPIVRRSDRPPRPRRRQWLRREPSSADTGEPRERRPRAQRGLPSPERRGGRPRPGKADAQQP